jgi:hypothetical protein
VNDDDAEALLSHLDYARYDIQARNAMGETKKSLLPKFPFKATKKK